MPAENPVRELIRRELLDRSAYGSLQDRIELFEPFKQRPITAASKDPSSITQAAMRLLTGANRDWDISGTNAADSCAVLTANGGIKLTTAGADDDQVILGAAAAINSVDQTGWRKTAWNPTDPKEVFFEALISLPQVTACKVLCGVSLTSALDLTTDDNQAKFQFSTEGAVSTTGFTACTSIGGTDAEVECSGDAVAADTAYRLGIKVSSTGVPRFYVNGIKVATGSALTANTVLLPFIGVQALTDAAKSLEVRWARLSRLI